MLNFKNEQHKLTWDDFRYILTVAKSGSLLQAANVLKVSHPTVFRRIRSVEARLGVRLFDKSRTGYVVTEAASKILRLAEKIDADIDAVMLGLSGLDERPSGNVRVASTDTLMEWVIPSMLLQFRHSLPSITCEISSANSVTNLSKQEADIALRPGGEPPDHLVGKRICAIESTIYRPSTWNSVTMDTLGEHPWVCLDDSLSHLASQRWLQEQGLAAGAGLKTNSQLNLANAAKLGLGLAILPCYLGERIPTLTRVCAPIKLFRSDLWLLYHPDLRKVKRIKAFIDHAHPYLLTLQDLFEGKLGVKSSGQ